MYWQTIGLKYILLECHLTKIGSDEGFFKNSQEGGGGGVVGDEAKLKFKKKLIHNCFKKNLKI